MLLCVLCRDRWGGGCNGAIASERLPVNGVNGMLLSPGDRKLDIFGSFCGWGWGNQSWEFMQLTASCGWDQSLYVLRGER
jgi:hypothetical protein